MKQKIIKKIVAASLSATLVFAPLVSNACTSFLLKANDGGFVYGRTMEFGTPLNSKLAVTPRNFKALGIGVDGKPGTGLNWTTKYAVAGMNALSLPVLVDGMNEKGLVGGLLYAPNTAQYQDVAPADSANSIASTQMLVYAIFDMALV
jgi:choloylglycine hydrolase